MARTVKVACPKISRWILLVLVSPLLGVGLWHVAGLSLLLSLWRWRGFVISCNTLGTNSSQSVNLRWQIPVSDTLILTAAIALCLGVMRFVVPGAIPMIALAQFTTLGITLAVVVWISTWAAFSSRSRVVRWGLSGLVVPSVGVLAVWATFGQQFAAMWWLCELVIVLTALTVFLSLKVFRLHGYRLVRVA